MLHLYIDLQPLFTRLPSSSGCLSYSQLQQNDQGHHQGRQNRGEHHQEKVVSSFYVCGSIYLFYICVYVHIPTYTHIHTVYVCICGYVGIHMCMCVCVYMCLCIDNSSSSIIYLITKIQFQLNYSEVIYNVMSASLIKNNIIIIHIN